MSHTNPTSKFHALIAAAGSGSRTGLNTPKQFYQIAGKTILQHTIEKFASHPACASINVIIDPKDANTVQEIAKHIKIDKIIEGSNTRKNSIYNGLKSLSHLKDKDIILTHDAARPFIHHDDINQILAAMNETTVATLAKPVRDTLIKEEGTAPSRKDLYAVQTPQAFHYGEIMAAHETFKDRSDFTDDTALLAEQGKSVTIVTSKHINEKITDPEDLTMAEMLLTPQMETRIGQGYDVHAFESEPTGRKLILCGIEIDHPLALTGHSDADVGLHTITDAILGAIGQGDIGRHFPPSDDTFKNMDSSIFLEKARDLVLEAGGTITNIDLTLICEQPKITPHAEAMITRTAKILQITPERVSIKATTSEKLGFTGRGEGIAATAVATVKVPAS